MLRVHRAARSVELVDRLADVLADAGGDPFAPEVVSVHSRGIERWLAQELSLRLGAGPGGGDGVAANITFPFPKTVVDWAMSGWPVGGIDDRPRDPWDPARSMWTLLELVEDLDPADLGPLGAHLHGEHGRLRRAPALLHVASLFDRYAVHRPSLLAAWLSGRDVDGRDQPLAPADAWQPLLWRRLRDRLGPSFAEQVAAVVAGDTPLRLDGFPARISLFGLTALPSTYLDVLHALGRSVDIHLFVLHPSPAQWDEVAPLLGGLDDARPLRSGDPTVDVPRHPLLKSWGRDSRELQLLLRDLADDHGPEARDAAPSPASDRLLQRLQADIVDNRRPPGSPLAGEPDHRLVLPTTDTVDGAARARDDSVQVHACHGRLRQVEVLRDVVLGLLSDNPTLQPRDIVVMCPDVEAFAPLTEAVFAADAAHPAGATSEGGESSDGDTRLPDVRVRIADRALREVNPLLRTVAALLHLPDGRVEASTVVELAHQEPVRRRFGFSGDDLEVIEGWVDELGVRWGLDLDHRRAHGIHTDANSWRAGLDRLLLGVAVAPTGPVLVAGRRPHDEVEGSAVDLAGRLAELLDRIGALVADLGHERPIDEWCTALRHHVDVLTRVDDADAWQRGQFDRLVDDLLEAAGGDDAPAVALSLPELRALLDERLRGRPSRANHRTGDLTVCTLVPMRSVPYRVVCLLGLDDETFPRRTVANGDDLIARHARVGDRDPRTEDRQLLLDALLAAGDHLVITYTGRDERTDAPTPPAVPLAELLDAVDLTARTDGDATASAAVTRHHPLRAADARAFDADAPFGFDPLALAGARARLAPPRPAPRFLDHLPAPSGPADTVDWADFVSFLRNPARAWLRARLGVSLRKADDASDDLLPLELDGLANWAVGNRLLEGSLDDDLDRWVAAERARGSLPVGAVGDQALAELVAEVADLRAVARDRFGDRLEQPATSLPLDLTVAGVRLVGAVGGIRAGLLANVDYGKPKPKRIMKLWLPWLAATASGHPIEAVLVSRGLKRGEAARATWFDPDDDVAAARDLLGQLVALYVRGQDDPLPLFESTSAMYAKGLREGGREDADKLAKAEWFVDNSYLGRQYGDRLAPEVQQVFGDLTYDELAALPPTSAEEGPGWDADLPSRFGRLAQRVWAPVFARVHARATEAAR